MDRNTLLVFAKRIFDSGSEKKSIISLKQLVSILEEQGAPKSDIDLVKKMIEGAKELKDISNKPMLTEIDIEIAARRASERKAREEAARRYSRC